MKSLIHFDGGSVASVTRRVRPEVVRLSADERRNCHLRIDRFVEMSPAAEVKALQMKLSDIEDHLPVNGQFRSDCLKYIAWRWLQIMAQKDRI